LTEHDDRLRELVVMRNVSDYRPAQLTSSCPLGGTSRAIKNDAAAPKQTARRGPVSGANRLSAKQKVSFVDDGTCICARRTRRHHTEAADPEDLL
jgi:hypothetical protein